MISRKERLETYDDYQFLNVERCDDWILRITMTNATMPHVVNLANMASASRSLPIQGCSRGLNVAARGSDLRFGSHATKGSLHAPDAALETVGA